MHAVLPRPHRDDLKIAVVGLAGGLALWGFGLGMSSGRLFDGNWLLVPLVAMAGLELLRRTRPWFAVGAGTLVLAADQCTQGSLATVLMYTDLVYAAVLYGSPAAARRIPVGSGLLTVAATLGAVAGLRRPEALLIGVAVGLVTFAPAATGVLVRNHRDTAAAERLRAEQTALLAEMDRTQAVTAERARMARELHDMVANHLSAIAIHSTAALSLDDQDTTRTALRTIRENSVDGLAEMRRLIGILRDAGEDAEPVAAPTLAGLGALVEQSRTNGLDVGLTVSGALTGLPAPIELAAYRIVQESLTNALKHAAPGGRVEVIVARDDERIEVRVDSPYAAVDAPRAPGSGAGLVGMRERAGLLGGSFDAGPAGTGTWRVRATLPLEGATEWTE
ncbi:MULTISPECIES: sensor histidine kinase [unclassified Streptomyces]|uniref:sensor histidine kinase n=1 Tax=unclassified Streptomyces TaxID=2593676 RepID=UPI00278BEB7C|nr:MULTISPECIES: histidine kinase [unclassified Streptomyces]